MNATLQKVRPGDPLVIPAATFNALIDTTLEFRRAQLRTQRDALQRFAQSGIILVRNKSGEDRQRFDVLGIDQPIVAPEDDEGAFKNRVAVDGVVPTLEHAARFVVLLSPLARDAVGPAVADGITVAKVKMTSETDVFAEVEDGHADYLKSGGTGSAGILWVDTSEDPGLAIIRVGSSGAAAGTRFGVVSSVPDPDSWYIYVRVVVLAGDDPSAGFEFDEDEPDPIPAPCAPGMRGRHFIPLIFDGENPNDSEITFVELSLWSGFWWAKPVPRWDMIALSAQNPIYLSDCNPIRTVRH